MATKILIRRGEEADLTSETLEEGEIGFTTDGLDLYVGSDTATEGFVKINSTKNIDYEDVASFTKINTDPNSSLNEVLHDIDDAFTSDNISLKDFTLNNFTQFTPVINEDLNETLERVDQAIAGKSDTDHGHGTLDADGAVNAEVEIGSGDKLIIADESDSGKTKKTSITFGNNGAQFLANNGQWASPVTAAAPEWSLVGRFVETNPSGTTTINQANIGEAFDIDNYDYKVVFEASTSTKDTSTLRIRLNDVAPSTFDWVYSLIDAAGNQTTVSSSENATSVNTGTRLEGTNDGIGMTQVNTEFIISQGFGTFDYSNTHVLMIKGEASALALSGPVANVIKPSKSTFVGSQTFGANEEITSINLVHDLIAGIEQQAACAVYKRLKATI